MKSLSIFIFVLSVIVNCNETDSQNLGSNLKPINSFGNDQNGLPLGGPWHMIGDSNYIYVSDIAYSSIFKYSYLGEHLSNFGSPGKPGVGPGEIANQTTIDVDENWLYVFDNSNLRLTLFDLHSNDSKVSLNKHSLVEFAVLDSTIFAFSPKTLAEPVDDNDQNLIKTFTIEGIQTQSFGKYLNSTEGMFAGLSLPDIEVDNNYIYVLFRYFPLLRVYSLDGKLLLQADITKPNQTELIKGNLNQRNFVKKQNYTFNFVNRGLFVVADRLFITKQERFVVIDEYKLTSDSLIYVTTFTYDGNLTDDYFVIDFFYREKSNSFFLLEKNDDFKVTEYEVIK